MVGLYCELRNRTGAVNNVPSIWKGINFMAKCQTSQGNDNSSFEKDRSKTPNGCDKEIQNHDKDTKLKVQDSVVNNFKNSMPDSDKVVVSAKKPGTGPVSPVPDSFSPVPDRFKCSLCVNTQLFSSMIDLFKHAQLVHCNPLGKSVTRIAFNCSSCSQKFSNYHQGIQHWKVCKIKLKE